MVKITIILAALLAPQLYAANYWNRWEKFQDDNAYPILEYVDRKGGDMVVVKGGGEDGISEGVVFNSYRASLPKNAALGTDPIWVATGKLKAIKVQKDLTIAKVIGNTTELSSALFPKFPGVMAGDLVVRQKVALVRNRIVTPTVTMQYFDLFQDPKRNPMTFEMSDEGMEKIKQMAEPFLKAKLSLLMVEGYTDHKGSEKANQIESYQRALTIRQYLIDEMGFDQSRVVAIGYGETEQIDATLAPGYVAANRRIVLKAVPIEQK